MHRRHWIAAASALALAPALPSARAQSAAPAAGGGGAPLDVSGIKYPQSVQVGGSTLLLNGAGTRYRLVVKVYTAGLYMAARTGSAEAALAAPGPKRLHVTMLRDIDANELGRLFTRGMQDNTPAGEWSRVIPGTLRMSDIFSAKKRLATGENFSVDFVPGQGTTVLVNGRAMGEPIREPEFFTALLRIWLGGNPADAALKEALLGRAPPPPVTSPGQQ